MGNHTPNNSKANNENGSALNDKLEGEWIFLNYFPSSCLTKQPETLRIKLLQDKGLS